MKTLLKKIEEKLKTNPKNNYAVFDFDNTCIINDIGEATINFLCENNLLKDMGLLNKEYSSTLEYHKSVLQHYYRLLDLEKTEQAYSFGAQCLSGFSTHEIKSLIKEVISFEKVALGTQKLFGIEINRSLSIRKAVSDILDYATQTNIDIYIISASPKYIVETAFSSFYPKIPATIIGVENKLTDDITTKELVRPMSIGKGKVLNIKNKIHPTKKPLFAVGDSMGDFAMLKYSQIPIVVFRGNELSAYARKNKWGIVTNEW